MSCHEMCDPCNAGDPECCYKEQDAAHLRAEVAALTKRAEELRALLAEAADAFEENDYGEYADSLRTRAALESNDGRGT